MEIDVSDLDYNQIDEYVGYALGWIDYPTDSVEQGSVWHIEPDKAPLGPKLKKSMYDPHEDGCTAFDLIKLFKIQFAYSDGIIYAHVHGNLLSLSSHVDLNIVICHCVIRHKFGETVPIPFNSINEKC